jgi:CheY-like chemotaxis protein
LPIVQVDGGDLPPDFRQPGLKAMGVESQVRKVLVVDDNRMYREAVRRNLEFVGYQVIEAEDRVEALDKIRQNMPHVVITDLDMRTRTEGLDLIRDVKARYPAMPVVLISAVGTFDEGALARQYGAMYVISKSRIDEEVENLYSKLDQVFIKISRLDTMRVRVEGFLGQEEVAQDSALEADLNDLLQDSEMDPGVKSEIYDMLLRVRERTIPAELAKLAETTPQQAQAARFEERLKESVPCLPQLDPESQTMFRTAERLLASGGDLNLSILRNVSFSYCFAVENEVKSRLGKKVSRFLSSKTAPQLLQSMYDRSLGNLDLFFNRYVILTFQNRGLELNVDITRQVLERMMVHGEKYKPDGLKALGVLVFCFGREFEFQSAKGKKKVENPLGIRGLEDEELIRFSNSLIRLQHLRNPYIHPEFSEREKIDNIREAAIECLNYSGRMMP